MNRSFYSSSITDFLNGNPLDILGSLANNNPFASEPTQRDAWMKQIEILHDVLIPYRSHGKVYFEFSIPRLGKRIDVVALIDHAIFVIEFKVGEDEFPSHALDQVWDYALDLKNFHESSHAVPIAPVLLATNAEAVTPVIAATPQNNEILLPIKCNGSTLSEVLRQVLLFLDGPVIDADQWEQGRYCPTPTIVEAAMALYSGHSVAEISRRDAGATNLTETSGAISEVIHLSKKHNQKSICFVTGVPGAGKTLVGLDIATKHIDKDNDLYSVFLSGNGPLVAILREALARDKVRNEKEIGRKLTKGKALSEVKVFIQNVHNFRDDCLVDLSPPKEHVALFDEAQRAWNRQQTTDFMRRKKKKPDFNQSEPEFLISCMNRHRDWAVIVCLVGGGQEINTGEAGISEWIESLVRAYSDWNVFISSRIVDSEYAAGEALKLVETLPHVTMKDELHLGVSMRSFRAETVSLLIKQMLDQEEESARQTLRQINQRYPIVITRELQNAKKWLKAKASASERYGIVVSSEAQRLKPHAIDVRSPMDPIHWFLDGKEDVRSSFYLEDVATEFHVQGLELDWACIMWDADFRYKSTGWEHWSFCGARWNHIKKPERKMYLKNAYRVLLTRARQGMVIVVPAGDAADPTRDASYYDPTFEYLRQIGFEVI